MQVEAIVIASYVGFTFIYILLVRCFGHPVLLIYSNTTNKNDSNLDCMVAHSLLLDIFFSVFAPLLVCRVLAVATNPTNPQTRKFQLVLVINIALSFSQLILLVAVVFVHRVSKEVNDWDCWMKYAIGFLFWCGMTVIFFLPVLIVSLNIVSISQIDLCHCRMVSTFLILMQILLVLYGV